jgi:hypothetical protein
MTVSMRKGGQRSAPPCKGSGQVRLPHSYQANSPPVPCRVNSVPHQAEPGGTHEHLTSQLIASLLAGDRGCQVIQQLPGIGPVLAAVIVGPAGQQAARQEHRQGRCRRRLLTLVFYGMRDGPIRRLSRRPPPEAQGA